MDDSTYETEEEPTPETESDEDIDSDKNEQVSLLNYPKKVQGQSRKFCTLLSICQHT